MQGFLTTYFEKPEAPPTHFIDGKFYNTKIKSSDRRNCDSEMDADMQNEVCTSAVWSLSHCIQLLCACIPQVLKF